MDLIIGGDAYGKLAFDKIRDEGRTIIIIDEDPVASCRKNTVWVLQSLFP